MVNGQTRNIALAETKTLPSDKKRVGIFGGTFNPIHNGQLIAAEQIARSFQLDKIIFVPAAVPFSATHRDAIAPSYRSEMVKLAISNNSLFDIYTGELYEGGQTTTFQTVKKIRQTNIENEYFLILGEHLIYDLPSWDDAVELSKIVQLIGIVEPNSKRKSVFNTQWADINYLNISSSDIRSSLRTRKSVRYLVPDKVAMYIAEFGLYRGRY